jgi:hypothetical protein
MTTENKIAHLTQQRDRLRRQQIEAIGNGSFLREENAKLREALEEVTRCAFCNGKGSHDYGSSVGEFGTLVCKVCDGTGRNFRGSEKARAALEDKP